MITISELKRRFENIVQVGTVCETKSKIGKALARVTLDDSDIDNKRVSAFLPVASISNSFLKVWIPIKVGEQVLVISPFGNANSGFIIRSIFNKKCKEPVGANEHTTIFEFEDGSKISYDSKVNELKVDVIKKVTIICKTANIQADKVDVVADEVTVDSPSIDLGKGGTGVVTAECKCAFTGNPHFDFSLNTRSAK